MITKTRWLIESRNVHIKSAFQFFEGTVSMNHAINLGELFRISGAILNKHRKSIVMEGATVEVAESML